LGWLDVFAWHGMSQVESDTDFQVPPAPADMQRQ
jgi:hypothetical protein